MRETDYQPNFAKKIQEKSYLKISISTKKNNILKTEIIWQRYMDEGDRISTKLSSENPQKSIIDLRAHFVIWVTSFQNVLVFGRRNTVST